MACHCIGGSLPGLTVSPIKSCAVFCTAATVFCTAATATEQTAQHGIQSNTGLLSGVGSRKCNPIIKLFSAPGPGALAHFEFDRLQDFAQSTVHCSGDLRRWHYELWSKERCQVHFPTKCNIAFYSHPTIKIPISQQFGKRQNVRPLDGATICKGFSLWKYSDVK